MTIEYVGCITGRTTCDTPNMLRLRSSVPSKCTCVTGDFVKSELRILDSCHKKKLKVKKEK